MRTVPSSLHPFIPKVIEENELRTVGHPFSNFEKSPKMSKNLITNQRKKNCKFFLCRRFYSGKKINKKSLFYPKFFEFEVKPQPSFFW